jgi:hypothetical protein
MKTTMLLTAALLAGCGSSPAMPDTDGGGGGGQDSGQDGPPSILTDLSMNGGTDGPVANNYPAGPYGNKVGDVFPPLVWEGYVDDAADAIANTKPYVPYSADAARKSGRAYAMIHVAEFT